MLSFKGITQFLCKNMDKPIIPSMPEPTRKPEAIIDRGRFGTHPSPLMHDRATPYVDRSFAEKKEMPGPQKLISDHSAPALVNPETEEVAEKNTQKPSLFKRFFGGKK